MLPSQTNRWLLTEHSEGAYIFSIVNYEIPKHLLNLASGACLFLYNRNNYIIRVKFYSEFQTLIIKNLVFESQQIRKSSFP